MPKHPHPADAYVRGCEPGVEVTLDLTVTLSCPHPGALPLVRATGHGAEALRAAILEIIGRNFSTIGMFGYAKAEIDSIFGERPEADCQLDRTALRAALNEVKQGLARALAQVPE